MNEGCPSQAALDAFVESGEPDGDVLRHCAECAECRDRVAELRADAEFLLAFRAAGIVDALSLAGRPVRPDPEPGTEPHVNLLEGYQILDEIHRGGQGVVYRAVQIPTQRTVAIKMLLAGRSATEREKQRFEREVRIAAGLRHPNIVTVYDGGFMADGRYAFAMEYIEGKALNRWSAGLARTPVNHRHVVRQRLQVMAKVCDAVLCAHQHGIVHRDLKPANILVDCADEPHILDFGIARDLGLDEHTRLTQAGGFAGTLAYASPEQVSGDHSRVDTRTDIYSLGVIMYEMMAGRMPYAVDGPMASAIRNIEEIEPAPLSRRTSDGHGPFADDEVSTIILKAMAKDPARRYQTAAGLGADIRRYLAGEAIDARRDSTWYVLRKLASRNRRFLATATIAVLALVVGGAAAGYGLLEARDESRRAGVQKARAHAEALAGRTAARLIQQTLLPNNATLDDEALGRYVRSGLRRLQSKLELGALAGDPESEAAARRSFASVSLTPQGLAAAEVHLRQAIAVLHHEFGEKHQQLPRSYYDLAVVLDRRGRYTEAERWVRRSIDIRRRLATDADPASAASWHLLTGLLIKTNDIVGADAACNEAMRICQSGAAVEAADRVAIWLDRSQIRRTQGRRDEAEAAALESLTAALASLSDEDVLLPECLRWLAVVYGEEPGGAAQTQLGTALGVMSRGQTAAALSAAAENLVTRDESLAGRQRHITGLETVLALKAALLGPHHIARAATLALMADDYYAMVDWDHVASAAEQSIVIIQDRLGTQHPALIQPYSLVWERSIHLEDYAHAVRARRRMLEIWQALSEQSVDDLWIANEHRWLAHTLALDEKFVEAEREYRACLDHLAAAGLKDHYLADIALGGLGWTLLHLGRPEEAERLTRTAVAQYTGRPSAPPDQRAWLERHLGHVLIAIGKLDEARPYVESALAGLRSGSSSGQPTTRQVVFDAIELAERSGDHATAQRLRNELAVQRQLTRTPGMVP